jgi:hypothetical protein
MWQMPTRGSWFGNGIDYAKDISASEAEASLAPGFYVATVAIPHGVGA